jgi:pimeloyl-ACP methyl ester carboxylesterase
MSATHFVETGKGRVAVVDNHADAPAIVLIHGNSSCKEVFDNQFSDPALSAFRLVALDLPGHGASDDASTPESVYTLGGYSEAVSEVLQSLEVNRPTVFGWSLGGHIALEMYGRGVPFAAVMISGTPPVRPSLDSLMAGFNIDPNAENLTGKRDFTKADALAFATHISAVAGSVDPHLLAMCERTDGRAREIMFGSIAGGNFIDEVDIVRDMKVPLAVVNGHDDPFVRPEYFRTLAYGSLWEPGVLRLEGSGHSPFLQMPGDFNKLLVKLASHA